MIKQSFRILNKQVTQQIPICLKNTFESLGDFISFDGEIGQTEQICNFTYTTNFNIIKIFNTSNSDLLNTLNEMVFSVSWGDNTSDDFLMINGSVEHTYQTLGEKTVSISFNSPFGDKVTTKTIRIPSIVSDPNSFDYLYIDIPFSHLSQIQKYNNDYYYNADNYTGNTIFYGVGKSRVGEKKEYGGNFKDVSYGSTTIDGVSYLSTGYTINNLNYIDLSDGNTYISGSTENFVSEEDFIKKLTRDEHYIGYVFEPSIYSDIFIERGQNSPTKMNLDLAFINNLNDLVRFQNGKFRIKNN